MARRELIRAPGALANLGDRAGLDLLERSLPKTAQSYASPWRRTIDTARALGARSNSRSRFFRAGFWRLDRAASRRSRAKPIPMPTRSSGAIPRGKAPPRSRVLKIRSRVSAAACRRSGDGPAVLVVHSGTISRCAVRCARSHAAGRSSIRDRSALANPDRPARDRLACRLRQPAHRLSRISPGDPAHWPARRLPCRCAARRRAAPTASDRSSRSLAEPEIEADQRLHIERAQHQPMPLLRRLM